MAKPQTEEPDFLFDVRCNFFLGAYQAAINEAGKIRVKTDAQRQERDLLVYRSYLAQGNTQLVLDEVKPSAEGALAGVRQLAEYQQAAASGAGSAKAREAHVSALKARLAAGAGADATYAVLAGSVLLAEGLLDDAWRCASQHPASVEARVLQLQVLLRLERPDVAEREAKRLLEAHDDHVLAQLAGAWVALAGGGAERVRDAAATLAELQERYAAPPALQLLRALSELAAGHADEAEKRLLEVPSPPVVPDALAGLAVCALHLRKLDLPARYLAQLRAAAPTHPMLTALKDFEDSFALHAARYSPAVAN